MQNRTLHTCMHQLGILHIETRASLSVWAGRLVQKDCPWWCCWQLRLGVQDLVPKSLLNHSMYLLATPSRRLPETLLGMPESCNKTH